MEHLHIITTLTTLEKQRVNTHKMRWLESHCRYLRTARAPHPLALISVLLVASLFVLSGV